LGRFLVTGGAGFIGGHICGHLLGLGHQVSVIDNLSTGRVENLAAVRDSVEFVEGDVRDVASVRQAMKDVEYVLHHAADISVVSSVENPVFTNDVNVGGTLNILTCARDCGVRRVVLASSSAIYGDTGRTPQKEDLIPRPLSPYGASKAAAELYMHVFHSLFGLETVVLRYFNVYGPRQNPKSQYAAVIPKFIDRILDGQDLQVYGDGEQTRDFVYVEDIARANYVACTSDAASGGVFNIAGGRSTSIKELAYKLARIAGREVQINHVDPLPGEIKFSVSDTSRAGALLGFRPEVAFDKGLAKTFEHFAAG
jgi:nucleoside-diphosphate-sugar epimerase